MHLDCATCKQFKLGYLINLKEVRMWNFLNRLLDFFHIGIVQK